MPVWDWAYAGCPPVFNNTIHEEQSRQQAFERPMASHRPPPPLHCRLEPPDLDRGTCTLYSWCGPLLLLRSILAGRKAAVGTDGTDYFSPCFLDLTW